jgi:hypothetical protein
VLELFNLIKWMLLDLFRSRTSLEAEVIVLRQQLNVLRRSAPKRPTLSMFDRLIFVWLYRLVPAVLDYSARDNCPLASRRLSRVLALEVSVPSWQASGAS